MTHASVSAPNLGESTCFAVVVPMYNEEAGAARCVESIQAVLADMPVSGTLIVVNDASNDATRSVLETLESRFENLRVVDHESNRGYGAALRTGAKTAAASGCEYVIFMDSDLTNPPDHLPRFIEPMQQHIDVIKATRFGSGGGMVGVPLKRRIMTRTASIISRMLFRIGVRDCTNGFRAVRTKLFLDFPLKENGFAIILEELFWAKKRRCTFANVPTTLYNRSPDQRASLFAYNAMTILAYLKHALRACLA